jgi:hypothetical protein
MFHGQSHDARLTLAPEAVLAVLARLPWSPFPKSVIRNAQPSNAPSIRTSAEDRVE